ncbi:MAG: PadR family transcriptional regulator [Candidatus Micrarchaeota archaeon]
MPKIEIKGLLRIFILTSLSKKEKTGKELADQIHTISKDWRPSCGTIYPLLQGLKKNKLVKPKKTSKRGEITYEITRKGKETIKTQKTKLLNSFGEAIKKTFPLLMMVFHDCTEEEAKEISREYEEFLEIREKIFILPPERRKAIIKSFLKKMKEIK